MTKVLLRRSYPLRPTIGSRERAISLPRRGRVSQNGFHSRRSFTPIITIPWTAPSQRFEFRKNKLPLTTIKNMTRDADIQPSSLRIAKRVFKLSKEL